MGTMRVLLRNFIKNRDPHSRCRGWIFLRQSYAGLLFFVMSAGGRATRRDLHRWFKICNAIAQILQIKSHTFNLQESPSAGLRPAALQAGLRYMSESFAPTVLSFVCRHPYHKLRASDEALACGY